MEPKARGLLPALARGSRRSLRYEARRLPRTPTGLPSCRAQYAVALYTDKMVSQLGSPHRRRAG